MRFSHIAIATTLTSSALVLGRAIWVPTSQATITAKNIESQKYILTLPQYVTGAIPSPNGIVVIEVSDFECPFCKRFASETFPRINTDLIKTRKVVYGFVNLPLTRIHRHAFQAASAAECAGQQGKFWAMHERLFMKGADLELETLNSHASVLNLKTSEFNSCMAGGAVQRVNDDIGRAAALKISSTPTLLIGTVNANGTVALKRSISGVATFDMIEAAVREIATR